MATIPTTLFSIGHSNVAAERLIALLEQHGIQTLCDVRSAPYSRYNPQFNRETLAETFRAAGIAYRFMGNVLGGKPADGALRTEDGVLPDYAKIAASPEFQRGIEQLIDAIRDVPDATLVLLGYGELEGWLRERAAADATNRIAVLPAVPPAELIGWVASADVAAMPIQPTTLNHRLTTPNKLFEAIAADVPVVASDLPGMATIVRETGCGRLVDPRDPAAIAAAVRAVLDAGADALVTTGFNRKPDEVAEDPARVRAVPFAPIGQLLDRVEAVVAAGGSGTTLAALSRGLPMLFVPRIANQPQVAAAVTAFGAGLTPEPLDGAVSRLLGTPELRTRAEAARRRLADRPSPEAVWSTLRAGSTSTT